MPAITVSAPPCRLPTARLSGSRPYRLAAVPLQHPFSSRAGSVSAARPSGVTLVGQKRCREPLRGHSRKATVADVSQCLDLSMAAGQRGVLCRVPGQGLIQQATGNVRVTSAASTRWTRSRTSAPSGNCQSRGSGLDD